jgi:hypothetical protein
MTSHLDDGTIHELLDGEIPSSQLPPLQAHIVGCAECRARLAAAREMVDFTDGLVELLDEPPIAAPAPMTITPLPSRAATRPWIRQLAWAASIAIAVGAGWYARGDVQQVLPAPTASVPPTSASEDAAQPATFAPANPPAIAATPARSALPPAMEPATKPSVAGSSEQRTTIDDLTDRGRAEAAREQAAPPAVVAENSAKQTEAPRLALRPGAAQGGGSPVMRAAPAADALDRRADGVPRDFAATRQLLVDPAVEDTLAIRMAALRWLFDSSGTASSDGISAICVAFSTSSAVGDDPVNASGGTDLNEAERASMPASPRPLRPGSACSIRRRAPMPTIETATGLPAMHVLVGGARFTSPDRAYVGMQQRQRAMSASGYVCDVERRSGVWVVVKCRVAWMA